MKQTLKFFAFFSIFSLIAFAFGCNSATNSNQTKSPNTAQKTPQPAPAAQELYRNAPPGAQPPNMLGSATAAVTVEEFADFQCPSCAQVHGMMKNIQSNYGSKIKFIYRHFPLSQMHKNAYDAALAAEAAGQQNRFWDMQNQLFTNQQAWATSSEVRPIFVDYAQKMGLDVQRFQSDMLAMSTKMRVDADIKRGAALNLNSTPSIFINGKSVPFQQLNVEAMRALIDAELQSAGNNQNQTAAPTGNASPAAAASSPATNSNASVNTTNSNGK